MGMRLVMLSLALAGCTRSALPVPHMARPRIALTQCRIDAGVALCRFSGRSPARLELDFAVREAVPRISGGVWLLGEHGELARVSPTGELSGLFESGFSSLASTRDLVCGTGAGGQVACARDFREDSSCSRAAPLPGPWVALSLEGPLLPGDPHSTRLCTRGAGGTPACLSVRPTCEAICLSFPACAPVRCADPCDPGKAPSGLALKAAPSTYVFPSSRERGAET